MKQTTRKILLPIMVLGCSLAITANATDATEELFNLLHKGGCEPDSMTARTWRISTNPVGTHGELFLGDTLEFELLGTSTGISRKGAIQVFRNGLNWESENGWTGQCIRDGSISQYIVSGDVDIDGCSHELAIGRLDHDDGLANRIELVFQDSDSEKNLECESYNLLHPGHAHGDED